MTPRVHDDDQGTRWVTLERPDAANALRLEDLAVLTEAFGDVGPARAVVLTAAGRVFCAGMHLDTFREADGEQEGRRLIGAVRDTLAAVRTCPVPTVALLTGDCLGAAFEMILGCDARVAHPDVRVGLPEVKLGIPSVVDAALLPTFVGPSRATEMVLTGDPLRLGDLPDPGVLATRLAPPERLLAETTALLDRLCAPTREVTAAQKGLLETWRHHGLGLSVEASVDVFAEVFALPATRAAIERYRR